MLMRTHPPRGGPKRSRIAAVAVLALAITGCTFNNGSHMEVDFLGARYRFYIYETPTSQLTVELRDVCKNSSGIGRQQWSRCSSSYLRDEVDVPSIGQSEWNIWTAADQWDDYAGAVEDVIDGGYRFDSTNQRYARNCLVGDHLGFQGYNWTTRSSDDSHCKRGVNAA
jgi:hypothetical protein